MATLLQPPSTQAQHASPHTMASRRVPLGNLPNATNSPFREPVAPGTKRPRTNDAGFDKLQHPAKKQVVETTENGAVGGGRRTHAASAAATATTTGRKAVAKKEAASENLNEIRQWQRHYKKLFPQMVFYYDAVPDDTRHRIGKQIQLLGSVSFDPSMCGRWMGRCITRVCCRC